MRLSLPYAPETPDFVDTPQGRRAVPERMTLAEFMDFPFAEKDHWELIGGVPVMSPAPTPAHQSLMGALYIALTRVVSARSGLEVLQDVDVLLPGEDDYFRPDVSVFHESEIDWHQGPVRALPLLVVEILSPSTGSRDLGIKREIYARAGLPEYWVVDPANGSLAVHVNPTASQFTQNAADEDGYVLSPFVGKALRIQRAGQKYRVLER